MIINAIMITLHYYLCRLIPNWKKVDFKQKESEYHIQKGLIAIIRHKKCHMWEHMKLSK